MRACEQCGAEYKPRKRDQRFCKKECQQAYYNAHRVHKPIVVIEFVCDLCGLRGNKNRTIRRFSLKLSTKSPDGKYMARGSGTLFLCGQCWKNTAGRRRRLYGPRQIIEEAS